MSDIIGLYFPNVAEKLLSTNVRRRIVAPATRLSYSRGTVKRLIE
jgi:hypothetical protein